MLFGAIPGVSMLTLAAILLPFTAHLSPEHGIMLFSVIYCTGVYGGAITAILFNIPGAPENAPTAFDGYPMTQKGQAGKAIGAAVMCSALGGTVSTIIMMLATAPIADWAISAFGPPEIFALVFFRPRRGLLSGRQNFLERLAIDTRSDCWLQSLVSTRLAVSNVMILTCHTCLPEFTLSRRYSVFSRSRKSSFRRKRKLLGSYVAPKVSVDFPTLKAELIAHKW